MKVVMQKYADDCKDGDIEKSQPLLNDQNSTTNIAPPKERTEFWDFFTGMSLMPLGAWKSVSLDNDATRNRYKDYTTTCAHSPIKVIDIIFILPMLFRQVWKIHRMEIALRFVAGLHKNENDGESHRFTMGVRAACEHFYNTSRDPVLNLFLLVAVLLVLFLGFLVTGDGMEGQWTILAYISLAVLMNCLCLGNALVSRFHLGALLSLATLSSCAAGFFRGALIPEAFIWISPLYDVLISVSYVTVGLGLSDVFVNWDILTRKSALGGPCGGAFAFFSVLMNISLFVPLPVLPSLLFGFSFGLPLSRISHLESSMVLGEPSGTYISWVNFVSKACFMVAIGIFLYSVLAATLNYCNGTCFNTTVHLITAAMKYQVTSYRDLFP